MSDQSSWKTNSCRRCVWGCLAALMVLAALPLAAVSSDSDSSRVVAVGDIHGGYDALVGILQEAELLDDEGNWSGGSTTLVQTGDFLDRGLDIREAMDLLRKLQEQAPKVGGQVIVLFGNHEAMNLLGFRRDVNPKVYERFVGSDSARRQEESWQSYTDWQRKRSKVKKERRPGFSATDEAAWKEAHPPGYLEYGEALSADGEYGRWLRTLETAVLVGDKLFVHGGIPPALASWSLDRINRRTLEEIDQLDRCRANLLRAGVIHETSEPAEMVREGSAELERLQKRIKKMPAGAASSIEDTIESFSPCIDYQQWFLVKEQSPLWHRDFARWTDAEARLELPRLLAAFDAEHFVVAHTTQAGEIDVRYGGRVLVIDTGMLDEYYPGGRASALEIVGDRFTAIYPDEREQLEIDTSVLPVASGDSFTYLGPDGEPLPFESDDQVLAFLTRATVTASERIGKGINHILKLTLEKDGVVAAAAFRDVEVYKPQHRTADGMLFLNFKDSFRFEPAAYRLDRLIGLGKVPPATTYKYQGRRGSIQLWIHNVMDEGERAEKALEPPYPAQWLQQRASRKLFDNLILNVDRNQGNILIDRDSWKVWLIDHGRAFLHKAELLTPNELVLCDRAIWRRLVETTEPEVREALDEVLADQELRFLWARWQALVEHIGQRIAEYGEAAVLFGADGPASE